MAWVNLAAAPPALRRGAGVAAVGNYIYVVGGVDADGDGFNRLDHYDISTGQWDQLTAPGVEIGESTVVATDADLLVFYGLGYGKATNKKYNFAAQQWSNIANPAYRCDNAVAVWDGDDTIYIMGGWYNSNYTQYVYAYSISGNTYTSKPDLPARRGWGSGFMHNGYLYYAGGEDVSQPRTNVYRLAIPGGSSWSTVAAIPTTRTAAAYVWRNGVNRFSLFGGMTVNGPTNACHEYDPVNNQWAALDPAPAIRFECAAAVASDGRAYVFGGFDSSETNLITTDWQYTFADGAVDTNINAVSIGASALTYSPRIFTSMSIMISTMAGSALGEMLFPVISAGQETDIFVLAGAGTVWVHFPAPVVQTNNPLLGPPKWKIREFGQSHYVFLDISPSEYARTKQADAPYEQLLDGSHARITTAQAFKKEEYQILWANIAQNQLDTLMGFLNKKVEITDHLLATSTGYVDGVGRQYLLSGAPGQRYAVAVKIREA